MLNTKIVKIGEFDINIIQFGAVEALSLRKELVENFKKQIGEFNPENPNILKAATALVYEIPASLMMKLFKNCSAIDVGQLSIVENFNKVFTNNLDGTVELAMEVLDLNGFFSLNIISILAKKIPALAPMEKELLRTLEKAKTS